MLNHCLKLLMLSVLFAILSGVPAYAEQVSLGGGNNKQAQLFVRDEVKQATSLERSITPINQQNLASLVEKRTQYNPAEQFLILQAHAKILFDKKAYKKALQAIENALALEESIPAKQLEHHDFSPLLSIKANSYAKQGDFEQAYLAKKAYLKRLSKGFEQMSEQETSVLNEKYKTTKKEKANELLAKQTQLTKAKIAEVEKEKALYKRNKVILIFVSILFAFLLTRQIKVSRKLKALSKQDHLTKVFNRRHLFASGQKLHSHYQGTGETFCVILLDVDHFKEINDSFGHDTGDQVLKEICQVTKEVIRSRDIFGRLGGEEFVLLLPEATLEQTKAIAEHIREKIARHHFKALQNITPEQPVTLSIGLVCVEQAAEDFDALIHAADQAMYHAKTQGRDQVVSYSSIK